MTNKTPITWRWPLISAACSNGGGATTDLTSHLVQVEENGDSLSNEELTANIILLFGAGHETTVNLIGNGLLALHHHLEQLHLLNSDPSLLPNAIEELLRYDSSVQVTSRTPLEHIDQIGGTSLEKGQSVVCLLGAANRDPDMYSDPDRLDITRADIRPLSFGGGSTIASAPNSLALKLKSQLAPCSVAYPSCDCMTSSAPIGGRRLCCVAAALCRQVGSRGQAVGGK